MIYLNGACAAIVVLFVVLSTLERDNSVLCVLCAFSALQLCVQCIWTSLWHYNTPLTMRWAYGGWKRTYTLILRDVVLCTCITVSMVTAAATATISLTYSPAVVSFAILVLLIQMLVFCLLGEVVNISTHKPLNGSFDVHLDGDEQTDFHNDDVPIANSGFMVRAT